jgi:hypothetical protein
MENRFFESTDCLNPSLQSGMTSIKVMIASARRFGWGSKEAVTLLYLVTWPSHLIQGVKTQDSKRCDSHH